MQNNYYFLRQLSHQLEQKLKGYTVVSCFSQNKEELVIELNNEKTSFFIKAHLLASFSCLSFPTQFSRAKKNSIDLFDEIILKKVVAVTQFENERSFAIEFEKGYSLIFKMHANRSNVLLVKDGAVIQIFRNQFKADFDITSVSLNRTIDWSEKFFREQTDNLKQAYFTFGREIWSYLDQKGFDTSLNRWQIFQETLKKLLQPNFYLVKKNDKIKLTLLPSVNVHLTFTDPIEAINEFFYQYTSSETLRKEKATLTKALTSTMEACQGYVAKAKNKLEEITDFTEYKLWADVLMANMYRIDKGSKKVELEDFKGQPITIKLKPELNVQKNAEIFYRKAKNQEIEIKKLSESIAQKNKDIELAREQLDTLNKIETMAELKHYFKDTKSKATKKDIPIPFHEVNFMGYKIWIGKNAINNDLLTLKYAHKDDLWLHAKDVAGSHVVVKNQSGKIIPKKVIERAAELAAYNSKRKTETLCPVAYTQKKFVRKRKGDLPGAVVVEKENVIMVTPKLV